MSEQDVDRFVVMNIPGRAEEGTDAVWLAYDSTLRRSVGVGTTRERAIARTARLNAEAEPVSPRDFQLVAVPGVRFTIETGHSECGTKRPRVTVRVPSQHDHRAAVAIAHQIAARAEALPAAAERWLVQVESHAMREATVFLELAEDTEREVEAGLEVLHECLR